VGGIISLLQIDNLGDISTSPVVGLGVVQKEYVVTKCIDNAGRDGILSERDIF
jgi:hypothetical protein